MPERKEQGADVTGYQVVYEYLWWYEVPFRTVRVARGQLVTFSRVRVWTSRRRMMGKTAMMMNREVLVQLGSGTSTLKALLA